MTVDRENAQRVRPVRLLAAGVVVLAAFLPALAGSGRGAPDAAPVKSGQQRVPTRLLGHDTSIALRAMEHVTGRGGKGKDPDLGHRRIARFRATPRAGSGLDGAQQSLLVARRAPAADVTFDGIFGDGSILPPDANGDVGLTQYVQAVNGALAVYTKTGSLVAATTSTAFWSGLAGPCSTSPSGDPIVLYDQLADRWLVSEFAFLNGAGPFFQCVAVSQTADASGAWYRYSFQISTTLLPDYPKFGVWPDGYYMSVNQFDTVMPGTPYAGAGVAVFNRTQMLAGVAATPTLMQYIDTGNASWGGMLPADLDGSTAPPANLPNPYVQANDSANQLQIFQFDVDWAIPLNTSFTLSQSIGVSPYDSTLCGGSTNCISQPSPGVALDPVGYDQLMYRLQYRNFTSGTVRQSLVVNQTVDVDTNHAGVRWYELRNTGSGWTAYQDGTYAPDADNRFMGSAAMNGLGELAVAYTAAGLSTKPTLRFSGREPADGLGLLTLGEGTLYAGQGVQTHDPGRWGDYSSLSVDPADDCTFWYTGEYYPVNGDAAWHTRIGSFRLPLCSTASVAPPDNVSLPTITGVAQQGHVLTVDSGVWSGKQPVSYTYEWLRCTPNCAVVRTGGTSYTLGAGDVGATMRVDVTGSNGVSPTQTVSSSRTATIAAAGATGGGSSGGTAVPDLAVSINANPTAVRVSDQLTYQVVVTDTNGQLAQGVGADVVLSPGTQYVSSSTDRGAGCTRTGASSLHCDLDFLNANAPTATATIVTTVVGTGTLSLTATASAANEPPGVNNTATYQLAVIAPQTFTDASPPRVAALVSLAKPGRTSKLRFKVWDDSSVVKVSLRVRSGSRTVATLGSGYGRVAKGQVYYLPWKPLARLAKPLVFCAVAADRAGKTSVRSCAPIRVR